MRAVEPQQDRHPVGQLRGEPDPGPAEQLSHVQIMDQRLISLLVPLQDGAGEHGEEGEQEHRGAHDPVARPRLLVRGMEEDPQQVQQGENEHRLRRPVVQGAGEAAQPDAGHQVAHRLVGVLRHGVVELRDIDPGDQENHERNRGDATQAPPQVVRVLRHRIGQRLDAHALVDGVDRAVEPAAVSRSGTR
nr:hypothetical protein [Streptomyces finlayi]